ncbi:MAG: heme-copper oxidase subunit III [Chloroflexi bacterium]|nr:heme-copper oxidase subunit III [Chloroflexota bacterium]
MAQTGYRNLEGDERELSREELQALRNNRTGVAIFQYSWIMAFVCLIVVNLQIRSNFAAWPPEGVAPLNPVLPALVTVAIIASSVFARNALQAIKGDDRAAFLRRWRIALGLGAVFAAVMIVELLALPESGQYSAVFRVMTAFHVTHALAIGYIMFRVERYGAGGGYDAVRHWGVEAAAKLWYFVTIAWLLFFVVLYVI